VAVNIGPRIGIEGEAQYRKELQNIIQQTKTLKSELEATESAFSGNTTAMEKNRAKAENLTSQIETQKSRVEQLNYMVDQSTAKYGEADTKTLKWKQALYEATTELNNMETQLKQMPWDSLKEAGEKISGVSSNLKSMGTTLTTHVTAPITAAAAAGVKYIADFDTSMSKVKALAGDASEDTADAVIKMAQDTGKAFELTGDTTTDAYNALEIVARQQAETTKYTAAETADAMSYMALAGWDVEEMANGLPGVLNLAAASQMDLSRASDIVTDQLTAFGYSAEDSAHFADVLATAQARSNTTTDQMGEALKYAGPVAGALGYSIEDVSVALGLMANSGIKASTAGTTLRSIMNRMAKPTKESENAMNALGLSLYDSEGNMYSFAEIMDQMRGSFGDLKMPVSEFNAQLASLDSQLEAGEIDEDEYAQSVEALTESAYGAEGAMKAKYAAMLAGTRGMSGLLAIVNTAPEEYDSLTEAINNADGAAETMANTMIDNLGGRLEILKSKLGETAFTFLEEWMPTIEKAVDGIGGLVDKLNSLDDDQKEMILTAIAVVAAAGPVIGVIGTIAGAIGTVMSVAGTAGAAITAAGGLVPAIAALGATILPVIAVVAGIALAIVGVVEVVKHWGEITEWFEGVWDTVTGNVKDAIKNVKDRFENDWKAVKDGFQNGWNNVKTKTTETWNNMKTSVSNAWNNIKSGASEGIENIKTTVSNGWDNVKTNAETKWNNIKDTISTAWDNAKTTVTNVIDGAKTYGGNFVSNVSDGITDKAQTLWNNAKTTFEGVKTKSDDVLGNAKTWGKNLIQDITDGFWDKAQGLWDGAGNIFNGVWTTVSGWVDSIKGLFNFDWELPSIKLPHFSWTWQDIGGIVSIPSISVDWYKKAYNNAVMFNSPTVLPTMGGMKGFGDGAGGEIVIGRNRMLDMMREATTGGDIYVTVNPSPGMDERALADLVADRIADKVNRRRAAFG